MQTDILLNSLHTKYIGTCSKPFFQKHVYQLSFTCNAWSNGEAILNGGGGGVVFVVIGEEVDKGSEMRESKAMECRRVFYPFLLSISL